MGFPIKGDGMKRFILSALRIFTLCSIVWLLADIWLHYMLMMADGITEFRMIDKELLVGIIIRCSILFLLSVIYSFFLNYHSIGSLSSICLGLISFFVWYISFNGENFTLYLDEKMKWFCKTISVFCIIISSLLVLKPAVRMLKQKLKK